MKEFKNIQHFRLSYDNHYTEALNIIKHLSVFPNLISLSIDGNHDGHPSKNELALNIYHQHCPLLQRLSLNGNIFDAAFQTFNQLPVLFSSSLRHVHVSKIRVDLALDILDQFPELRSFSATLYGDVRKEYPTPAIVLPERIRLGLPGMRSLSLTKYSDDNYQFANDCGAALLRLLLKACPNLRALKVDVVCEEDWEKLLLAEWWAFALSSHDHLRKIYLRLKYTTRDPRNTWQTKYRYFQSSAFFAKFNPKISYKFDSEFMRHVTYDMYIEN